MNAVRLPLFLNHRNKYLWGVPMFATGTILYLATNHFHLTAPHRLPLLWLDREIPFIPESVWIYISEWVFLVAAYLRCRDLERLNRYFYSYLALQFSCLVVFTAWPTIYPRELYPLSPSGAGGWTYVAFDRLRQADLATNCCPSLHVAGLFLSIVLFGKDQRGDFLFFLLWGTLVGISTLTTKQHYAVDVIAGLAVAGIIHWVFRYRVAYRAVGDSGAPGGDVR